MGPERLAARSPRAQKFARKNPLASMMLDRVANLLLMRYVNQGGVPRSTAALWEIQAYREMFLGIPVPAGRHRLEVSYDPPEVRWAIAASGFALVTLVFALTVPNRSDLLELWPTGLDGLKPPS